MEKIYESFAKIGLVVDEKAKDGLDALIRGDDTYVTPLKFASFVNLFGPLASQYNPIQKVIFYLFTGSLLGWL